MSRTIYQLNTSNELIAEHASAKLAALTIEKPKGEANILLCAGNNHVAGELKRKAYGFFWCFSDTLLK